MQYRAEIDGLRALAVLPVMLFHAGFPGFGGGFVGVDTFFVISGYLITSIIVVELDEGRFSISRFYERRARRILPALFLVVTCSIPLAIATLPPLGLKSFGASVVAVTLFSSNILFWSESGYFGQAVEFKPLLHTWSLGVEEQYYLLFPPLMMVVWCSGRRATLAVLAGIFILSLATAQWASSAAASAAFFLLPFRAWELMIGALCAIASRRQALTGVPRFISQAGSLLGLAALVSSIGLFDSSTPFPSVWALLPTVGTAFIILFAVKTTLVQKVLSWRPLVGVGLISYSAYLWHQPLFAFARHLSVTEPSLSAFAVLGALSLALAYLSWKFVEAPFRRRDRVSLRALTTAFGTIAAVAIVGGLIMAMGSGWPQRFDPRLAPVFAVEVPKSLSGPCDFGPKTYDRRRLVACRERGAFVYLIGDSHARALTAALRDRLARENIGLIVFVRSACMMVPELTRDRQRDDDCSRFARRAWTDVTRHPAPVVFSARWRLNLEGNRFDNGEGGIERGGEGKVYPRIAGGRSSLEVTHAFLEQMGEKLPLVLVDQIPEAGWDVPSTMFKRQQFAGDYSPLTTSLAVYDRANQRVDHMLHAVHSAKAVIDVASIVCDRASGRCLNQLGQVPLYGDDDHPSQAFAKLIAREIVDELLHITTERAPASSTITPG